MTNETDESILRQAAGWRRHWGDFDQRVWLNTSHQGAIPLRARDAVLEAAEWKLAPHRLTGELFRSVPDRLRRALGRLIGTSSDDIVLANGASHGQHIWASGLGLEAGDEVLLMQEDFPSNRLPWLRQARRGVLVRDIEASGAVPTADEVAAMLGPRTRAVSLSWVHSFTGRRVDLEAVGEVCRAAGVPLLVNTTQGLGNLQLDVGSLPIDGITNAGWKWLCGHYAVGFCWMRPEFRRRLDSDRAYWLAFQTAKDLERAGDPDPDRDVGARRYDLFGTANFQQFHPWATSLELLLDLGVERIERIDAMHAARLLAGMDRELFRVVSADPPESAIVVVEPLRRSASEIALDLEGAGIDVAVRRGRLRFSPHLYTSTDDLDRLLQCLHEAAG